MVGSFSVSTWFELPSCMQVITWFLNDVGDVVYFVSSLISFSNFKFWWSINNPSPDVTDWHQPLSIISPTWFHQQPINHLEYYCIDFFTGWWFGTCFIFHDIWNSNPNWLIFFIGVETTNQFGSAPMVPMVEPSPGQTHLGPLGTRDRTRGGYSHSILVILYMSYMLYIMLIC